MELCIFLKNGKSLMFYVITELIENIDSYDLTFKYVSLDTGIKKRAYFNLNDVAGWSVTE